MKDQWLIPRKWEFIVNRAYLPFSLSVTCFDTCKKYTDRVLPLPEAEDIYACYDDNLYYGYPLGIFSDQQIKEYKKLGSKFLWHMAELCETEGNELIAAAEKLSTVDHSKKTNKELADILEEFGEKLKQFSVFLNYPWSLESFFDAELTKIILNYEKDESRILEWKKILAEPVKFNESQFEQLSLLRIAKKISNADVITGAVSKEIDSFIAKYGWSQTRWLYGRPANRADVLERIRHLIHDENLPSKITFLEKKSEVIKKQTDEFIKQFKIEKNDIELIRLIKEYVFIRTFRTDIINHAFFYIGSLLEESAKRLGVTYEDLLYLSYQEILSSLKAGVLAQAINIGQRKKRWALFREGDSLFILGGEQATLFAKAQGFDAKFDKSIKELAGQIGYKGKVTGTVKTLITPNDVKKVKKGDILVAVMTFPSYIAAMEKAAAFVTDEGGILCHASIIAREMKKPCVISTKIATKVLKDGMMVEVDANRGIVKIIKS